MLRKTITYTNPFTDQEVTEEHYFHISKADLVEMEMEEHAVKYEKDGETLTGMQAKLQRIVDSEDGKAIIDELKDIIRRAYGKKEGDRFLKTKEIADNFLSSEAFSQLLWELCTNHIAAAEFMNGIIPGNLDQVANELREEAAKQARTAPSPSEKLADPPNMTGGTTEVHKEVIEGTGPTSDTTDPTGLSTATTPRVLTQAEVIEMDSDELKSGLATGRYKLS